MKFALFYNLNFTEVYMLT